MRIFLVRLLSAASVCSCAWAVHAAQIDIHGPNPSVAFGTKVAVLPNGNFVVTDPNGPISGIGAVYLYSPSGALISTLTGTSANDHVGNGGIQVAGDNFVVMSNEWNNGSATQAGAATWVNGSTGLNGSVAPANSLVGTHSLDRVPQIIAVLSNGNYVVGTSPWNSQIGAATWCKSDGSTVGPVSFANSLTGSTYADSVSSGIGGIKALSDGNYVVSSIFWSNPSPATSMVGAVTWVNGSAPFSGVVAASNSLIGTVANDQVGSTGVSALKNGHYVVSSGRAQNGNGMVGASTWRSGGSAVGDVVVTTNSLYGTVSGDEVGLQGAILLSNGNYVVGSQAWSDNQGAATWGNGGAGVVGPVSETNSLVGGTVGATAGREMAALSNGKYVVSAPQWQNGAAQVGAAILLDGDASFSGTISASNALVGTSDHDYVGIVGITALSDGNYVVNSANWNSGAGAATWGSGAIGITGPVLPSNSITGSLANENLAFISAIAVPGGSYVVFDPFWNTVSGGFVWCRAGGGTTGAVSAMRLLHGTALPDYVGSSGGKTFSDGYYAIASPLWNNNIVGTKYGAVTFANGHFRIKGVLASWNSVIGGVAAGQTMNYDEDAVRHQLVVGRPAENMVSLFTVDQIFADDFDP